MCLTDLEPFTDFELCPSAAPPTDQLVEAVISRQKIISADCVCKHSKAVA